MQVDFHPGGAPLTGTACPACADQASKPRILAVGREQLYACAACGSAFFHPQPRPDYRHHTADTLALRDYVENGAGIDLLARLALRALRGRPKGRLLDVGCGFGFTLDFARRRLGWIPRGVEPSTYGRIGARMLRLPIGRRLLRLRSRFAWRERYDAIFSSEVIEHVPDPSAFLDILISHLAPDGMLVLTTPDRAQIDPATPPNALLAILSAGFHIVFLHDAQIRRMLGARGFAHVEIERVGVSIAVFASRQPFALDPASDLNDEVASYYEAAHAAVKHGTPLSRGLAFRRYWTLVQSGRWDDAAAAFQHVQWVEPHEIDPAGGDPFASDLPFFAPALAFARATELLVPLASHGEARATFAWAYALCRAKLERYPSAAMLEASLLPRAKFHEALANVYVADMVAALACLDEIESAPTDLMPRIDALRDEARAALDRMAQPGDTACA
jgi:SAM-dependent methyltransferase